jgi:hypothetical protein
MTKNEKLYVVWVFLFQILLITHFAIRKWAFPITQRYGWLFYTLGIPALIISIVILLRRGYWGFWVGGMIQFIWSIYGYYIEFIVKMTTWRNPLRWEIAGPYVFMYLATNMFYWWPIMNINKIYWFIYTVLFLICTYFNITSH